MFRAEWLRDRSDAVEERSDRGMEGGEQTSVSIENSGERGLPMVSNGIPPVTEGELLE